MDNTMHSVTGQFWASWFALTIFEEKHTHKGTVGEKQISTLSNEVSS